MNLAIADLLHLHIVLPPIKVLPSTSKAKTLIPDFATTDRAAARGNGTPLALLTVLYGLILSLGLVIPFRTGLRRNLAVLCGYKAGGARRRGGFGPILNEVEVPMDYVSRGASERRHRLIILTDMENEPDDSQTMVKLLMYSNEIDIEGLVAVSSRWLPNDVFPESIRDRVLAYSVVRPNLMKHAPGWPAADLLLGRIAGGQRGYGMAAVGKGRTTAGSEAIVRAVDHPDPRPVWIAINAGANTLAQALWDVCRTRSADELRSFVSKLRVYDDSGQDDAGAWICHTFPDIFYMRSRAQVFGLFGPTPDSGPQPWEPLDQYWWAETHVRTRHGLLGALYPQRLWFAPPWNAAGRTENGRPQREKPAYAFMDGGGTTTWLGLANKGLFEPEEISWGGWGGRFSWEKVQVSAGQAGVDELEQPYEPFAMYPQAPDHSFPWSDDGSAYTRFSGVHGAVEYRAADFAPLWRWREAYTRDFQARMDWCVTDHAQANHHPNAVFMGDDGRTVCRLRAEPGEVLDLDASGSYDPDGDEVRVRWSVYPEAGTYHGQPSLAGTEDAQASITIPQDAGGRQIHVILEVTDQNAAVALTSYRRVVIDVKGPVR